MKITRTMIGGVACAAIVGVQGCAISPDPYVNGMATGALATAAVSWLFYSANDGYYYDHNYNRMPRNYRPPRTMEIRRIDSMDNYRRLHPRGPQVHSVPHQPQRVQQVQHVQPRQPIGNPPQRTAIDSRAGQNQQYRRTDNRVQRPQQSPRVNHPNDRQPWQPQFQR